MYSPRVALAASAAAALTFAFTSVASAAPVPRQGGGSCASFTLITCKVKDTRETFGQTPSGTNPRSTQGGGGKPGKVVAGPPPKCTSAPMVPQPPPGSVERGDKTGTVYQRKCLSRGTGAFTIDFVEGADPAAPGAVAPPPVDPVVVARQAVATMRLDAPKIRTAPKAGAVGLVGLPVWFWAEPSPTTTGPNTASATAGAVTVTATATVTSITWSSGDGKTVTCAGPGTPYNPAYGAKASPTCGHTYIRTSGKQPGAVFQLKATSTWVIDWQVQGGGQGGQLTETRTAPAQPVAIGEAQAVGS